MARITCLLDNAAMRRLRVFRSDFLIILLAALFCGILTAGTPVRLEKSECERRSTEKEETTEYQKAEHAAGVIAAAAWTQTDTSWDVPVSPLEIWSPPVRYSSTTQTTSGLSVVNFPLDPRLTWSSNSSPPLIG